MASTDGPKSPSRPTVKRLFALSRNLCAFPECGTELIHPASGSVVGEICHIKGDKPLAARYDAEQTDEQRQSFDNLILLCNVHHKVVDDDETAYTPTRLYEMKQRHESERTVPPAVDDTTAERFITVTLNNSAIHGSLVTSYGQTGGQTAHAIHNTYYGAPTDSEPTRLEAKLDFACDLELLSTIGCPGLRLSVICRGGRPAKIQSVHLLIDNVSVMKGLRQGFGADFGYTPLEGSTETLDVKLIPLTTPRTQEGYVLNCDDVARFFYPFPLPSTTLAMKAHPEHLSLVVKFFDDKEEILLVGRPIKDALESVYHAFRNSPGQLKGTIAFAVRVKSTTPPGPDMMDLVGKLNPNDLPLSEPDDGPHSGSP